MDGAEEVGLVDGAGDAFPCFAFKLQIRYLAVSEHNKVLGNRDMEVHNGRNFPAAVFFQLF